MAVLAGTPGDQGLKTAIQSIADHGKDQVINAGQAPGSKSLLTVMTQENIVGNEIDLWHQNGKGDRQCNF